MDWQTAFESLAGAYSPATMRAYRSDVQTYVDWCKGNDLAPFPATIKQLRAFIEKEGRERTPATVRRRLYALSKVHRLLDLADPTQAEAINLALRKVTRANPVRPQQALGMTGAHLERFLAAQPSNPWGLRNSAMLSLGYELMTRRSELVALRDADVELTEKGTLTVLIRRSKSDQEGRGRIAITSRHTAKRLQDWLEWRGDVTSWLFCPIHQGRPVDRALSDTTVKVVIKTAAKKAGYSKDEVRGFSGHSMRVGAAQDFLCKGYDTAAIMRAGGWKSTNVLARYLEMAEQNVWET